VYGLSSIFLTVNVKSFDNPIQDTETLQNIMRKEKPNILIESKKFYEIEQGTFIENCEKIKQVERNSLTFIKNLILGKKREENTNTIINHFKKLNEFEKVSLVSTLTYLFKRLNILDFPSLYSYLIENETLQYSNKKKDTNYKVFENLTNLFYDSGINPLSFFRKFKNNKLNLIDLKRENFSSLINEKFAIFKQKLKNVRNLNLESFKTSLPDTISYYNIEDCLLQDNRFMNKKKGTKYINNAILNKIFDKTNDDIMNTLSSNPRVSPF
jgi:hypothetical protein